MSLLSAAKFFSIQMDGSTNCGNIDNELFIVLHFNPYATGGKVKVCDSYFTVRQLRNGSGRGLFECLENAMTYMTTNWKEKLVGLGCDGTNANIAHGSLKGHLTQTVPWIVVSWCIAHRLELSLKDTLKGTFFSTLDELLMQVYYVYEKSPKKCKELKEVVEVLKTNLDEEEMPTKGGTKPVHACSTRFVVHKVTALGRLIDRLGAYLGHFTALSEERSTKAADRQKLKGYVRKWRAGKVLLGCAFFHDLLKPASVLCQVLQEEDLCVVWAIESIVKTKKAFDKITTTSFEDLPTVKKVIQRVKRPQDRTVMYISKQNCRTMNMALNTYRLIIMSGHKLWRVAFWIV